MNALIAVFIGITALELLLWLPPLWRWRRLPACLIILVLSVVSGLLLGTQLSLWTGLIFVFNLYRLVNLLRVLEGRLHPKYLYQATRRTSYWLISLQLIILGVAGLDHWHSQAGIGWLYGLSVAQLVVTLVLLASTRRHLRTTRAPVIKSPLADKALPTVSVAIPARNETDDLEACLRSLVASDYPKLEILVLDDCSQNKRTPGIIRDFAQNGVRFIAGQVPPEQWLAKNYAYHQLAKEANGELLLFCGVDTRFEPGSLRAMVEIMAEKRKTMVSFIPRNQATSAWHLGSLLFQTTRYAWELLLPRRLFRRPPVLSTCWLIAASTLRAAGGFAAFAKSVSPESHLARYNAAHQDGYSFLQAHAAVGLVSLKGLPALRATAIRTRYPQLHRRPELVSLLSLVELAALVIPAWAVIAGVTDQHWVLILLAVLNWALISFCYLRLVQLTYRTFLWRSLWTLPVAALHDVAILNYSMWQYEFREVIWKGRNVCVPIMQVIPSLPKTD